MDIEERDACGEIADADYKAVKNAMLGGPVVPAAAVKETVKPIALEAKSRESSKPSSKASSRANSPRESPRKAVAASKVVSPRAAAAASTAPGIMEASTARGIKKEEEEEADPAAELKVEADIDAKSEPEDDRPAGETSPAAKKARVDATERQKAKQELEKTLKQLKDYRDKLLKDVGDVAMVAHMIKEKEGWGESAYAHLTAGITKFNGKCDELLKVWLDNIKMSKDEATSLEKLESVSKDASAVMTAISTEYKK